MKTASQQELLLTCGQSPSTMRAYASAPNLTLAWLHPRMIDSKTVLLTDVVDSTQLTEQLADEAMAELWAAHDRAARDLLPLWRGLELGKTDGMLLLFDCAADAVGYALAYHRELQKLSVPLRARAGLHVGPVVLRANSAEDVSRGAQPLELEGITKPIAARIMSLARGGQTLMSADAREDLGKSPWRTLSHGHWRMKGVSQPAELFEVGEAGSPWEPPPDSAKVYRVIRDGDLWKPVKEVAHNLPRERDTFVGRAADLVRLAEVVDSGAPLITLLGTGGSGKTRLARRFAWTWLGDFPGGVWFCDLSLARSLDGLASAVATAVGLPLGKEAPTTQIGHALASRARCLVILDNFEQVAELAAASVGQWVERAREAVFLVTSRERLRLPGEHIFSVEPLPEDESVELFETRAQTQDRTFRIGPGNKADVIAIVRTLDGIALAIELAAARIRVLPPRLLRERLRERFSILAGARGLQARQATLLAAIDWSWELLAPWEKSALAQCSAFAGGFTLEAAEAVVDLTAFPQAPATLDVVEALVDKSLLRTEASRLDIGEPYFAIYVSVQEYAASKLRESEAFDGSGPVAEADAWKRHGRFYASFGNPEAVDALSRQGGLDLRNRLALDLDNLVVACRRAVAQGDTAVACESLVAAWQVLEFRGPFEAGIALGREVLAADGLAPIAEVQVRLVIGHALLLTGKGEEAHSTLKQALAKLPEGGDYRREEGDAFSLLGRTCERHGRPEEARRYHEQALAAARACRNRLGEAVSLGHLGSIDRTQGRFDEARLHFEQSLSLHRKVGNRRYEPFLLASLGIVHRSQGRVNESRVCLTQALDAALEIADRHSESFAHSALGMLHHTQGRLVEAISEFEISLSIEREMGDRRSQGVTLGNLGATHANLGQATQALPLYEQALMIHREVGNRLDEGVVLGNLGNLLGTEGRIDEAIRHCDEALVIHRQVANRPFEQVALSHLGSLHRVQGSMQQAFDCHERALRTAREIGNRRREAITMAALGRLHIDVGDLDRARQVCEEALGIQREVGSRFEQVSTLINLGLVEDRKGQIAPARQWYEEALVRGREVGDRFGEGVALTRMADLLAREGNVDAASGLLITAEACLREVGDRVELCHLLCVRGQVQATAGQWHDGLTTLAEASTLATRAGAGPASALSLAVAALQERLQEKTEAVLRPVP